MMPTSYTVSNDDDKYAKFDSAKRAPESLKKYQSAIDFVKDAVVQCPQFVVFACFVFVSGAAYICAGRPVNGDQAGRFASSNLEILGLLMLRHKIRMRGSVAGISGMTMLMYAFVYAQRITLSTPDSWNFEWKDVDFDFSFGSVSFVLVLDIVKSVWFTHRSSYQMELDVLKIQCLVPGCYFAALLVRPHFHGWTTMYGYWWSSCLYMDVLALMPQVVMLAKSMQSTEGKVEAPIAHFVAATFLSRVDDLWDSLVYETSLKDNNATAYWTVVFVQALHLLLVADFMYYWIKARAHNFTLSQDVRLVADDV
jgi:hypothetical protein